MSCMPCVAHVDWPTCRSRVSPLLSGSMRHVRLGRTGLRVSRLCLGTMTFGLQCDEPASAAILDRAAVGGITFLDTSDVSPLGGGPEAGCGDHEVLPPPSASAQRARGPGTAERLASTCSMPSTARCAVCVATM